MRGLLILLLLYPFLELYSLLLLADRIGGGWTLLWVVASIGIGVTLMRGSKFGGLLTLAASVREGKLALFSLLWPLRIMLAGLLLAVPGLISDLLALLLLLPWKSPKLADLTAGHQGFHQPPPAAGSDDIIEGEYQRVEPHTPSDRQLR